MRKTAAVLLTCLLLFLSAQAGHTGDPRPMEEDEDGNMVPVGPEPDEVLHDCIGDHGYDQQGNDLAAVLVSVAERTGDFVPEAAGEAIELETLPLLVLDVIVGQRAPTNTQTPTPDGPEPIPARLYIQFEDNRNHVHVTELQSTESDWSDPADIVPVVGDERFLRPLFVDSRSVGQSTATTPAGALPSDPREYFAVEIGYRFADVFAPGSEAYDPPFVIEAEWVVETSYEDDGEYAAADVMSEESFVAAEECIDAVHVDSPELLPPPPTVLDIVATPDTADRHPDTFVRFTADLQLGGGSDQLGEYTYEWTFVNGDDVIESSEREPSIRFAYNEPVTANLTVTDDLGRTSDPFEHTDNLVTFVNLAPVADFTISPLAPTAGQDIQFTDASYDEEGDDIVGWSWDFGDGSPPSTVQNPVYAYPQAGAFKVTLTAEDEFGATSDRELTVFVCDESEPELQECSPPNAGPVAAFSADPGEVDLGDPVTFTDESTDRDGTVVAWAWDFGDGSTSNAQNPVHTYEEAGIYQVTLTVTDDGGLQGTRALPVRVKLVEPEQGDPKELFPPPIADFTVTPEEPVVGEPVTLEDATQSETELESWLWFFGDGSDAGEGRSVQHTYEESGTYRVRLTVTDEFGVRDTVSKTIVVGVPDDNESPGLPIVALLVVVAVAAALRRR